ncbi:MAG: protein kinase [Tatlockia sp.]|nr:protein kinase [Tatlockia sp.]
MEFKSESLKKWRETIQKNPYLSHEQRQAILVDMDKQEASRLKEERSTTIKAYHQAYKVTHSSSSAPNSPTNSSGSISNGSFSYSNSNPIFMTSATSTSTTHLSNLSEAPNERSSNQSPVRTRTSSTSAVKMLNLAANILSISPPRDKTEEDRSEDSNSKESPTSQSNRKLPTPRLFTSNAVKRELSKEQRFYETIPLDKSIIDQILSKSKYTLNKKDGKTEKIELNDPNLQLVTMPNRDIKTNLVTKDKTAILINNKQIEGKGAFTTVVKGYDLLNCKVIAVKLFYDLSDLMYKTLQKREIKNLSTIGWYFGICNTDKKAYALFMKYIEGVTYLDVIYSLNHEVNQDDIWSNYCTQKKELSFKTQFELIIDLMEQLIKLHQKYKLLHRDLKPTNIKVSFENEKVQKVRLVDYESAILIGTGEQNKKLTGTDPYIHPALWYLKDLKNLGFDLANANLNFYDIYTDIYAFAIICGEILTQTGQKPLNKFYEIQKNLHTLINEEAAEDQGSDLTVKKENFYKRYFQSYLFASTLDEYFALKSSERNFQQNIRLQRRKAQEDKPIILTEKIRKFLPDVFKLETIKNSPDKYETYADFKKNMENYILYELKKMANKMLDIQPLKNPAGKHNEITSDKSTDSSLILLIDEAKRMKSIKENYKLFSKKVKHIIKAPTQLEKTINKIDNSYNGDFFQHKSKYHINKKTNSDLMTGQKGLLKEATEQFKQIFERKGESEVSLTL